MPTAHCRRTIPVGVAALVAISLAAACGRSATSAPEISPTGGGSGSQNPSTGATATAAAGDFGSLRGICGPGSPTGAATRGVTNNSIRIGVLGDVGASIAPGLGQEFFDAADAFSSWCNAAGGINGRKIVVDKLDAKVFNAGQVVITACQKDFMLVGGGTPLDTAAVKPRLACKMGAIPAYTASKGAAIAGLQAKPYPVISTQLPLGGLRLLAEAYPNTKAKGVGVGQGDSADLAEGGKKTAYALKSLGLKDVLQLRPLSVDNYRPYMEEMKSSGVVGLLEQNGVNSLPEIQAMKNVGWSPEWIDYSNQFYKQQTVDAAKSLGTYPTSYADLQFVPFDLADQSPAIAEIKKQLSAVVSKPLYTSFTAEAYSAWTLFAKSASACGSALTQECVLSKADSETAWTGGGIQPPSSTSPSASSISDCVAIVRLTNEGWVYDKKVTQPNSGFFNCDEKNIVKVPDHL